MDWAIDTAYTRLLYKERFVRLLTFYSGSIYIKRIIANYLVKDARWYAIRLFTGSHFEFDDAYLCNEPKNAQGRKNGSSHTSSMQLAVLVI